MNDDRSVTIQIGGMDYEMVLTTRATKEIAARYGGLEKLGDELLKAENFETAIDEIVWLITLLVNQGILRYNLKNRDKPKVLITGEEVELLTTPAEMGSYKDAILAAMVAGSARHIQSEEDPNQTKNAVTG